MTEHKVAAVDRALTILDCFDGEQDCLALRDIAERTGLYKSTILRLVGSLEHFGYLSRRDDGLYMLGPTLWRLGSLYRRRFDFADHVRPVLSILAAETAETASFYIRDGERRVCLFRQNGPQTIRHHLDEGVHLSLDYGAAGHVIRAYTELDNEAFDAVREAGHAVSLGERDPDTASVAAPVFGAAGRFMGALTVSGLRKRLDEAARAKALDTTKRHAASLGPTLIES